MFTNSNKQNNIRNILKKQQHNHHLIELHDEKSEINNYQFKTHLSRTKVSPNPMERNILQGQLILK